MAEFQVGDLVYESYSPVKHGVVIEVKQPDSLLAACSSHKPIPDGLGLGAVLNTPRCRLKSGHESPHIGRSLVTSPVVSSQDEEWPITDDEPSEEIWFSPLPTYVVKRPNGGIFESGSLQSFRALVDDHAAKLARHQATLAKLEALAATVQG